MSSNRTTAWPQQALIPTDIPVGPCAWQLAMLAGEHADYVAAHRSLIVVGLDDDDAMLAAAAPRLADLPVLLNLREPAFARRLAGPDRGQASRPGPVALDMLALWVADVADLKGGAMMQTLRRLHDEGVVGYLGLGHLDVRNVEWLALHTPARVLVLPFSLEDQAARYRAITAARDYGMACVAAAPAVGVDAIRFALGASGWVLPVLEAPLPSGIAPMTPAQVEQAWQAYREAHAEPAPLPSSRPPE